MSSTQCLLHHTYPYSYHNHSVCLINGLENWCTFSQHISQISIDMYFIILCGTIVVHNLVVSCWPCNSFGPKENCLSHQSYPPSTPVAQCAALGSMKVYWVDSKFASAYESLVLLRPWKERLEENIKDSRVYCFCLCFFLFVFFETGFHEAQVGLKLIM